MLQIIPNYEDLGFNTYLEKSLNNFGVNIGASNLQTASRSLNFDQVQTSGSLGSKIQIGGDNIIIDGENKRIIINDGYNDRVLIGLKE